MSSMNPVLSSSSTWVTPALAVVYIALAAFSLVSLVRSSWLSSPRKALVAVGILIAPFFGSLVWIAYIAARRHAKRKQHNAVQPIP